METQDSILLIFAFFIGYLPRMLPVVAVFLQILSRVENPMHPIGLHVVKAISFYIL